MKIKNGFLVVLMALILFVVGFNVKNVEAKEKVGTEVEDIVKLKQDLVEKHKDKGKKYNEAELKSRTDFVESEIHNLYDNSLLSEEERIETLNSLGIYKLETEEDALSISPYASSSNVSLSKPSIFYDSLPKQWVVYASGKWTNTAWKADIPSCCYSTTKSVDIGGMDAFGVTYYNTSGSYAASVVSSSFVTSDGGNWNEVFSSPSNGNGKTGVAFQYQDKAKLKTACCDNFQYLGSDFSLTMTYNSSFGSYNGNARTFYTHTWNKSGIDSISFGAGKGSYGVSVNLSNTSQGWTIYSSGDTPF